MHGDFFVFQKFITSIKRSMQETDLKETVYLNTHNYAMLSGRAEIYRFKNLVKCSIITASQWGYDKDKY